MLKINDLSSQVFVRLLCSGRHASRVTMSAKVAAQKFSFPFSAAVRLSQDELGQKGCIQVKALALQDLQQSPVLSSSGPARHDAGVQGSPKLSAGGDARSAPALRPNSSQSGVKLMVDGEDQRPATKRQLSSESAARTITAVKKSAVRTEAEEPKHPKPKTHLGQRTSTEKRRRRKDLFASSEVFHRIDSHAIRTGAEVTPPPSGLSMPDPAKPRWVLDLDEPTSAGNEPPMRIRG